MYILIYNYSYFEFFYNIKKFHFCVIYYIILYIINDSMTYALLSICF